MGMSRRPEKQSAVFAVHRWVVEAIPNYVPAHDTIV
jgi:hypothetical protein